MAVTSKIIDESKAEIYAEAGIPEYWLIRPEKREADLFLSPTKDGYLEKRTLGEQEVIRSIVFPVIAFKLCEVLPPRS